MEIWPPLQKSQNYLTGDIKWYYYSWMRGIRMFVHIAHRTLAYNRHRWRILSRSGHDKTRVYPDGFGLAFRLRQNFTQIVDVCYGDTKCHLVLIVNQTNGRVVPAMNGEVTRDRRRNTMDRKSYLSNHLKHFTCNVFWQINRFSIEVIKRPLRDRIGFFFHRIYEPISRGFHITRGTNC